MAQGKQKKNLYPAFAIKPNKNPHKFFAIPLFGFLIKIIILFPVFIEGIFLGISFLFFWIINSFAILFTGKYLTPAYDFFVGFIRFYTKISAYIFGLTDRYPGFSLETNGLFMLDIEKPKNPNRILAIPILGLLIRLIILIPYLIFSDVLQLGSWVAMVISWFPILTKGIFPESTYEFEQDTMRVRASYIFYLVGISDVYPSFRISMSHQTIKILLLIAGSLLLFNNVKGWVTRPQYTRQPSLKRYTPTYPNQYNYGKNTMKAY